jgi:hypothetical protein
VFEDVKRNPNPVPGVLIHDPQLSLRRWALFPHAAWSPSEDAEQEDDTTNDELFHARPSLVALVWLWLDVAPPSICPG